MIATVYVMITTKVTIVKSLCLAIQDQMAKPARMVEAIQEHSLKTIVNAYVSWGLREAFARLFHSALRSKLANA